MLETGARPQVFPAGLCRPLEPLQAARQEEPRSVGQRAGLRPSNPLPGPRPGNREESPGFAILCWLSRRLVGCWGLWTEMTQLTKELLDSSWKPVGGGCYHARLQVAGLD